MMCTRAPGRLRTWAAMWPRSSCPRPTTTCTYSHSGWHSSARRCSTTFMCSWSPRLSSPTRSSSLDSLFVSLSCFCPLSFQSQNYCLFKFCFVSSQLHHGAVYKYLSIGRRLRLRPERWSKGHEKERVAVICMCCIFKEFSSSFVTFSPLEINSLRSIFAI